MSSNRVKEFIRECVLQFWYAKLETSSQMMYKGPDSSGVEKNEKEEENLFPTDIQASKPESRESGIYNAKSKRKKGLVMWLVCRAREEPRFFCVEEVHPGSDRTSRSVARNQVPTHKLIF